MIDPRPLFGPLHHGLVSLLQSLDEKDWWRPTVCGDWTVHDLAIHLYSADVNVLSGDRDHFRNPQVAPPPGDLSDWEQLLTYIDGRNASWVDVNRRLSPRLLTELLDFTGLAVNQVWPQLDMSAPGNPVNWVSSEPQPVWIHVAREYTERWIHQQQLRDAVGKPGMDEEQFVRPVVDAFMLALPRAFVDTPGTIGDAAQITLSGEAPGTWTVLFNGSEWNLTDQPVWPLWTLVEMSTGTFWRMASRTIGPDEARLQSTVTGDQNRAEAFFNMVSMIVG